MAHENPLDAAASLLDAIRLELAQLKLGARHAARLPENLPADVSVPGRPGPRAPILRPFGGWSLVGGFAVVMLCGVIAALDLSLSDERALLGHRVPMSLAALRAAPSVKESKAVRSDDGPSTDIVASPRPLPLQAPPPITPQVPIASMTISADADTGPDAAPLPGYAQQFAHVNATERDCLRRAVYYEARGEPVAGQIAVAQVILNRVKSGHWRHSICGVIYQGVERGKKCQFSFACRRSRAAPRGKAWQQAAWIADEVLDDTAWLREMSQATHFHRHDLSPVWRLALKKIARVGSHVFYAVADASPDMSFAPPENGAALVRQQVPFANGPPIPGSIRLPTLVQVRMAKLRSRGALHRVRHLRGPYHRRLHGREALRASARLGPRRRHQ